MDNDPLPFRNGEALNKSRVHMLIGQLDRDRVMAPAKRTLLLTNLHDQLA